jgi:hypothetical protein
VPVGPFLDRDPVLGTSYVYTITAEVLQAPTILWYLDYSTFGIDDSGTMNLVEWAS